MPHHPESTETNQSTAKEQVFPESPSTRWHGIWVGLIVMILIAWPLMQPSVTINNAPSQQTSAETATKGERVGHDYTDSYYSAPRPTIVGRPYPVYQEASITVLPVIKRGTLNGKDGFIVTTALGEYEFVIVGQSAATEDKVEFLARTFNSETQEFEYAVVDTK